MMYPTDNDIETIGAAKAICASCPVAVLCGEHALAFNETEGVWGGMTSDERRSLHRRRLRLVYQQRQIEASGQTPLFT